MSTTQVNKGLKAKILTLDEIRNCEGKDYNPYEWSKNIDRMLQYKDVVFYLVEKDNVYSYNRYYVEYTLNEGLRLLKPFAYSCSLTNGGFYRLDKVKVTKEGKTYADFCQLLENNKIDEAKKLYAEIDDSNLVLLSIGKFYDETTKKMVVLNNSNETRKFMVERSKKGLTFTKGL
jgi:hypothetical protein